MDDSETVTQFCAITASDPATAQQFLAIADQNLETAISLFFEGGGASLPNQQDAIDSTNPRNQPSTGESHGGGAPDSTGFDDAAFSRRLQEEEYGNNTDGVREAIRPVTETLVDPVYGKFLFRIRSSTSQSFLVSANKM